MERRDCLEMGRKMLKKVKFGELKVGDTFFMDKWESYKKCLRRVVCEDEVKFASGDPMVFPETIGYAWKPDHDVYIEVDE